ncbi:MAG: hypothetical protein HYT89_03645 [Candidatus Omnitrophica bacterium]|nr:hypothetical protein [Candidatus Omnitrophota bacterium]
MRRYIYLSLLAFCLAQSVAYAEMIRGVIVNLDPAHDTLSVKRTDASKDKPQQLDVKVKSDTQTKNVASLKELQVGHEVKIDAKEDKTSGVYEAKSVEVTSAQSAQAPSSAGSPSQAPKPSDR